MPDEFTQEEKQIVSQNLENFPHLNSIIHKNRNFFRKYNADNYQNIPVKDRDGCLEFTLANILKNMSNFLKILQKLEMMLTQIPHESKIKFGRKLSKERDFFGTFSEIEVYYNLFRHGKKPDIEPKISMNRNSVDLGFFLIGKYFLVEVKTPHMCNPINNYINSLPSSKSDPDLHIGTGFLDVGHQCFIDTSNSNSNMNPRAYPIESLRTHKLIFEDFIGGNLKNIDNPFSCPIILIINYTRAYSATPFYYAVLEFVASMMRENSPKEIQGILFYPPPLPIDTTSYFFLNPNYDFLSNEIGFFSSLMNARI